MEERPASIDCARKAGSSCRGVKPDHLLLSLTVCKNQLQWVQELNARPPPVNLPELNMVVAVAVALAGYHFRILM